MGMMDKIKGMFGGAANAGNIDKLKEQAAGMKGQVDGLVDQYGDKLPGSVRDGYDKVSEKVDAVIPKDPIDDVVNADATELEGNLGTDRGVETTADDIAARE